MILVTGIILPIEVVTYFNLIIKSTKMNVRYLIITFFKKGSGKISLLSQIYIKWLKF